jgi:hypothetical protein
VNVFSNLQRAIDLYKKHRVKLPTKGDLDIFAPTKSNQMQIDVPIPISGLENRHNQVQMDESVPISSLENRHNHVQVEESVPISSLENKQDSVSASDATKDAATPALQPKEVETLSPAKEQLEEFNQTCSQMEQDHDSIHTSKIGVSSPSSDPENQEAAVPKDAEEEDRSTFDQLNTEDAEDVRSIAAKSEALLVPTSHEECENMNIDEATVTGFSQYTDEKLDFGDTKGNPLIFEDGSPKACDALMPGSNESESLILSRIHHSPESTH